MQKWILQGKSSKTLPTVHIVSDSVGTTAQGLVRAAAACFEVFDPAIEILPRVISEKEMISEIDAHVSLHRRIGEHPFRSLLYVGFSCYAAGSSGVYRQE